MKFLSNGLSNHPEAQSKRIKLNLSTNATFSNNTSVCPPTEKKNLLRYCQCVSQAIVTKTFYLIYLPSLEPLPELASDIVLIYNLHVVNVHSSQRILLRYTYKN